MSILNPEFGPIQCLVGKQIKSFSLYDCILESNWIDMSYNRQSGIVNILAQMVAIHTKKQIQTKVLTMSANFNLTS